MEILTRLTEMEGKTIKKVRFVDDNERIIIIFNDDTFADIGSVYGIDGDIALILSTVLDHESLSTAQKVLNDGVELPRVKTGKLYSLRDKVRQRIDACFPFWSSSLQERFRKHKESLDLLAYEVVLDMRQCHESDESVDKITSYINENLI
jgi:hypothetical protein